MHLLLLLEALLKVFLQLTDSLLIVTQLNLLCREEFLEDGDFLLVSLDLPKEVRVDLLLG